MAHTLILNFVAQATRQFVYADDMRAVLSLMLVSGKPVLLYGPGGHGKSELTDVIRTAITGMSSMVVNCLPGMTPDELFGGPDLDALHQVGNRRFWFNTNRSFLPQIWATFEEFLDASPKALVALKDTLTAGALRNRDQVETMHTRFIVAITNKTPAELLDNIVEQEVRDSVDALLSRFPIQLRVVWQQYAAENYMEMFEAVEQESLAQVELGYILSLQEAAQNVVVPRTVLEALAQMVAHVNGLTGKPVAPRTMIHARDLIKASAVINGRSVATLEDITAVKYLYGMEQVSTQVETMVREAEQTLGATLLVEDAYRVLEQLLPYINQPEVLALVQQLEAEVEAKIRPSIQEAGPKAELLSYINGILAENPVPGEHYSSVEILGTGWSLEQLAA